MSKSRHIKLKYGHPVRTAEYKAMERIALKNRIQNKHSIKEMLFPDKTKIKRIIAAYIMCFIVTSCSIAAEKNDPTTTTILLLLCCLSLFHSYYLLRKNIKIEYKKTISISLLCIDIFAIIVNLSMVYYVSRR